MRPMKVAIVDDVEPQVLLFKRFMERLDNVEIETFTDPALALPWCIDNEPDLILLDYVMTDMDGAEFLRQFYANEQLQDIPVVVVTGAEDKGTVQSALEAGANDVLRKPVDDAELLARARNMLLLRARYLEIKDQNDRLRQAEKLTALGTLAGGVAHDFNNILTIIGGYTKQALKRIDDPETAADCLSEVVRAADKGASLTRQLLAFSRRKPQLPRITKAKNVLAGVQKLVDPLMGELHVLDIDSRLDPAATIKIDPDELSQAIMNLVINARDAMPSGGRIVVASNEVDVTDDETSHGAGLPPGRYIAISVTDEGIGIDRETLEHIFEPYFTTKEQGKGTGLGLAMAFGFANQNDGVLDVESEVGKGSCFTLYLPVTDLPPEVLAVKDIPNLDAKGETILLVDDNPSVLNLVKTTLEELGYVVLTAGDGLQALDIAESNDGEIDLLLSDIVMPGLDGFALGERLKALWPNMRTIFMSGYPNVEAPPADANGAALIQKPFDPTTVAVAVRDALDDVADLVVA